MIVAYNPHTLPVYLWVKFESNGLIGALPVAFLLVLLAAVPTAAAPVPRDRAEFGSGGLLTRDGWHHIERALPGDADNDGR